MDKTILPSGEEVSVTPSEILKYLGSDALRQVLRQERLHWHLKTNADVDYYDNSTLYKYSGEVHNKGSYQRMEIRTFPDNGAYGGYAGLNNDSGVSGIVHDLDKWDNAMSQESKDTPRINRTMVGAMATVQGKPVSGLDSNGNMSENTDNHSAMLMCDPYDARVYAMTGDNVDYMNNETRNNPIPRRAVARIGDIPTRVTQLLNDINLITDPSYSHTDNNFSHSNRYVTDNMDDRTFVYPEISKDRNGNYIQNVRYGLNGNAIYEETDVAGAEHKEAATTEAKSSYNKNKDFSGFSTPNGMLQGVFRSIEELEKVDLCRQKMEPNNSLAPGARRSTNYYILDGDWSSNWFDKTKPDSYLSESINPSNMEIHIPGTEPHPYKSIDDDGSFDKSQLYQWRYNRVDAVYPSSKITIYIVAAGTGYSVGDTLRWNFRDDSFLYRVTSVGSNGQIQEGEYIVEVATEYDFNPSTNGIGVEFNNVSSSGNGARLAIDAKADIKIHSTQIKNNLYAYVDVVPTVPSDNTSAWSDTKTPDTQNGQIHLQSSFDVPSYSGLNSGRGGVSPSPNTSDMSLWEHGGNATAGAHVHLFRYVIDTDNPTCETVDGIKVYTGAWVDQGPIGIERPSDIKALYLSNSDTNCFNNYYKFMFDLMVDSLMRNPDAIYTNNPNALSIPYFHIDQVDPTPDRRFTVKTIDPDTGLIEDIDVTNKVIYINAATGCLFCYNSGVKNDPDYGYGYRTTGWIPMAGAISK